MEKMEFKFTLAGQPLEGKKTVCGVVGSGNLEVIVEKHNMLETSFTVQTVIEDYQAIWKKVIEDFVNTYQPAGLRFTLNDNGATPAVVTLRLQQALEAFGGYQSEGGNYLELDARARINRIFDNNSFIEWLADEEHYSPHLAALNLPGEGDDGLVIGDALLGKQKVLVAAQQKDFMGGAVGEIHGAKLTGLFKAAVVDGVAAVIVLIDSGGVRLHEANAGEIAISETIRAIFEARHKGVATIAVVCGKNGAFGGMGIVAACMDYLIINEVGRVGVSGPEVIQAVAGINSFDALDRSLVWRVYGGKTRYLQGVAHCYTGAEVLSIREALIKGLDKKRALDIQSLKKEHRELTLRLQRTAGYQEEGAYLQQVAPQFAATLFDMNKEDFLKAAYSLRNEK